MSRLEGLSEGTDHDDPFKGELALIARQVNKFLSAANQVKQDIAEQLKCQEQARVGSARKRALEVENEEEEEESEMRKKQRHKAARRRAVSRLRKEDESSAQDDEMPSLAPRVETDTLMSQDGDNNSTAGTSIATALARREGSVVIFSMPSVARKAPVEEPKFQVKEPKARLKEPKARTEKPKTRTEEPKTRAEEPKTRAKGPKARTEKPNTRAEVSKARVEESQIPEEQGMAQEEDFKAETHPVNDDTDEEDNHGVI